MSYFARLEQLIERARQCGYQVRYEDLGGKGGGVCEFGGKRWIFVDLAVSAEESWEALQAALGAVISRQMVTPEQSVDADGGFHSARKVG